MTAAPAKQAGARTGGKVMAVFRAVAHRLGLGERKNKKTTPRRLKMRRLPVLTLSEFRALDLPKRRRLLPWLMEGGLTMIYGPRGVGKTHFCLSLAVALASGKLFIKWAVEAPIGVLVVDGEMPAEELRERLDAWHPGKPVAPLEVLSHEVVFERMERDLNLGLAEWQEAIKCHLESHPEVRVLIVDNLSCLLPSVREDKRDDWAQNVMPFLISLRRRAVAVILIHHAGKSGNQRGTSAREDALDTVICLDALPDHDATHGAAFRVTFTKARGCFGDDLAEIEARIETAPEGPLNWSWKPVEESNRERLLTLVKAGVDSVKDAAEELQLTPGAVSKLKKKLQNEGQLETGRKLVLATS